MSYNPNHHYNRREPNSGLPNQPHRSNSNVYNNAEVDVNLTHPAHAYNSSDVRSGRAMEASEFGNTTAFTHSISQQQSSYRPNVSSMNYQPSNAGLNARTIDSYNPTFQNPKFAPQNQNSVDSLHSLKQTLAHTLQNLNNSSAASAYAQPEHAYRPLQGLTNSVTSMTRNANVGHAYNAPSQAQDRYDYEQAAESSFQRSMPPPAYVHSTHQSNIPSNRVAQSTLVDGYHHGSKFVDTRISAAVAPVPGDVRYQSTQQAHSAHHMSGISNPYNANVPNRAVADGNSQTFAPTQVPRVEHSYAQPQLGASAYYNRRPDNANLTAPRQQMDMNTQSFHPNRGSLNPREMIGAGGAGNVTGQLYDQHSYSRPTSISAAAAVAVGGIDTCRGSVGYHQGDSRMDNRMDNRMDAHRADIRDVSPHSSYRPSLDKNPSQYVPDSYSSMHAPHATAATAHARANPLSTLAPPTRPSKWSAELVDPLDIYDKLLHNSLCIYEEPSANVSTHASLGKHSISRDDRNITTTTITTNLPTSNRYSNNTMSPTNASRKRAISPSNSVASRDNYYSGGDRYTHSHGSTERSTRPRGGDYRDSYDGRNRYESQDNRRSRRSRSPSRSHSTGRGGGRSYNSYPSRSTDRSGTESNPYERRSAAATVPTSRDVTLSVSDKPNYALCTPAQIYTTYRTPTVSLHYTQYPTILHVQDLCVKYPRMYIPNDFLRVTVDAESMLSAVSSGIVSKLALPVPLQVEYVNPTLIHNTTTTMAPDASTNSMLEAPKYTTVDALSANNSLVMPTTFHGSEGRLLSACEERIVVNRFSSRALPVKFQVRVLVCCGVEDPNSLDPNKPLEEQLRVLCGQRKSGMMLLGCPWEQHLDTDIASDDSTERDTPLTNRSCLVRTVQRALFAQALLRIPVETTVDNDTGSTHYSSPGLISLCEVNYLRPAEVEDGVTYEEQMEVTTIFLYTLQPHLLHSTEPYNSTELYSARVTGASVGPSINENVGVFDEKMLRLFADREKVQVASVDASEEEADAAATDMIVSDSATCEVQPSTNTDLPQVMADASVSATVPDSVEALLSSLVASEVSTDNVAANAIDSVTEGLAPEVKINESAVIAQSSILSIPAEHVEEKKQLSIVIPSEPTLLLCPMLVTSSVLNDKKANRDVVGLKMGTLAELTLGYSQTDRTERVFELALAGELTMCLLATDCANTVTDFVLAGHPVLRRDVDARVTSVYLRAVKEMNLDTATQLPAPSTVTATNEATAGSDASVDAASSVVAEVVNGIVNSVCSTTDKVSIEGSEDSAVGCSFAIDKTPGQQVEDVVKVEPLVEKVDSMQAKTGQNVFAGEAVSSGIEVDADDEIRDLKRRFLSAARWFDVNGEKCLHVEHLKMILLSSTRALSPGAVKDAVKRVCENDLFQYEAYL